MVRVGHFVNELTSTSIPVEIAAEVHRTTSADVLLVSFYDSSDDEIDPDVAEIEVPVIRLDADGRLDIDAYQRLRNICDEENLEILHTHQNSTGSLARLATAGSGTVVVNTEHNDHRFFSHLQKVVNSVTYPLVDVNVSNSRSTAASFEWYERLLFGDVRQEVVYNGIDRAKIDADRDCPITLPEGPNIVIVGTLTEQKNHTTLLRAFRSVNHRIPQSSLVVVGDGPLYEELEGLAVELGVRDSVLFTGYLPRRDDVYSVLDECDVGVFPSWYEGFCVAAVEAMAVGLPIVVSDLKVLREVVGEPGVFADPDDPTTFADAICDLLEDSERRSALGEQSRKRAHEQFSLERTAREYYNIYKRVARTAEQ
jgi:glycosyltransferase involved in cell wall biosynthesis